MVGRKLAKRVGSTRPTITPDLQSALGLFVGQHLPTVMGRLLAQMTERARQQDGAQTE